MSGQRSILRSRDEQLVTRARVCFRAEKPITTVHVDTKLLLPTFMYIAKIYTLRSYSQLPYTIIN